MLKAYLAEDEANDSHGCAEERSQHEKLETVDDALVELPA